MQLRPSFATTLCACLAAWTVAVSAQDLSAPTPASTTAPVTASLVVQGQACHGANVFNDEPISDYANTQSFLPPDVFAFWNTFKMVEVGVVDNGPSATNAKVITASTPLDSLMGTYIMPGYTTETSYNPDAANQPVNNAFIEFDFVTSERRQLPFATTGVHKLDPARNINQVQAITLGRWNQATGVAMLNCLAGGTGVVAIYAGNLIPNMAYTAWQVFAVTDPSRLPAPGSPPIAGRALGGVPNYMVADSLGRGKMIRLLNYCPLEVENPLMFISLLAHFDHGLYGATPDGFGNDWAGGLVGADHLCFETGNHLTAAP